MKDRVRRREKYTIYDQDDFDRYAESIDDGMDRFLFSLFFYYMVFAWASLTALNGRISTTGGSSSTTR